MKWVILNGWGTKVIKKIEKEYYGLSLYQYMVYTNHGLFKKVRVCVRFIKKLAKKGQKNVKKVQNIWKIEQQFTKFEIILKRAGDCGQLLHAINC